MKRAISLPKNTDETGRSDASPTIEKCLSNNHQSIPSLR